MSSRYVDSVYTSVGMFEKEDLFGLFSVYGDDIGFCTMKVRVGREERFM